MEGDKRDVISEVSDRTFITELIRYFGGAYAVRMVGWSVLVGAAMKPGEPKSVAVARLVARGVSKSGAYRFLDDVEAFKRHLERLPSNGEELTAERIVERIREDAAAM